MNGPAPKAGAAQVPLVSIGMSVLNGGPALQVAVRSLLAQTLPDWELLLLDDGSTDGAVESIEALQDPRIRVVRDGRNKGLSVRLNEALDLARGRYFARMDHDDISHPDRLRLQVGAMEVDGELDLLACRCIRISDDDRFTGYLPFAARHEEICRYPWLRIPMAHPSWLGRTDWFRRHRYPVPAPYYAEDFELLLRASHCSKYGALPQVLMAYRVRSRIDWNKSLRARLSQLALQRRYFLARQERAAALMASGAFLVRVAVDGCLAGAQAAGIPLEPRRSVDPRDAAEWHRVIQRFALQQG